MRKYWFVLPSLTGWFSSFSAFSSAASPVSGFTVSSKFSPSIIKITMIYWISAKNCFLPLGAFVFWRLSWSKTRESIRFWFNKRQKSYAKWRSNLVEYQNIFFEIHLSILCFECYETLKELNMVNAYLVFVQFLLVHHLNHMIDLVQWQQHHVQSICIGLVVVHRNHLQQPKQIIYWQE